MHIGRRLDVCTPTEIRINIKTFQHLSTDKTTFSLYINPNIQSCVLCFYLSLKTLYLNK